MCIALGVSIVLAYSVRRLNRLMNIAIDLICIIPASAMFNIRMTNFIRKEDILSKIDRLWLCISYKLLFELEGDGIG